MTHRAVVPFKRWHMEWLLEAAPSADGCSFDMPVEALRQLESTEAWTAQVDGYPVACGGFTELWPGRCAAWVLFNEKTGPFMRWLTKEVNERLEQKGGRIEMTVRKDFEKGHRWAAMLGFKVETPVLRKFGPEGEDHVGYVRIEGGT